MRPTNCINCGAPLSTSPSCLYCGTIYLPEEHNLEIIEVREGRSNQKIMTFYLGELENKVETKGE